MKVSLAGPSALVWAALALPFATAQGQPVDADAGQPDLVQVEAGAVRGAAADGVRSFLGLPYAAPSVGPLRWRPLVNPAPRTDVLTADKFGNSCVQVQTYGKFAQKTASEDRLYLNVVTPALPPSQLRPVMVWLHGGGLINGRADDYDGSKLVTHGDVVVVTLNYRLNVFGFLAHPALDSPSAQAWPAYTAVDQLEQLLARLLPYSGPLGAIDLKCDFWDKRAQ